MVVMKRIDGTESRSLATAILYTTTTITIASERVSVLLRQKMCMIEAKCSIKENKERERIVVCIVCSKFCAQIKLVFSDLSSQKKLAKGERSCQ